MAKPKGKVFQLPFGMDSDELKSFAETMARSLKAPNIDGASFTDPRHRTPSRAPQPAQGVLHTPHGGTLAVPSEFPRWSWPQKMAYFAARFRSGRVPASHIEWMREQLVKDSSLMETMLWLADQTTNLPLEFPKVKGQRLTREQDTAMTEAMVKMHAQARWADYGFNVFSLTGGLAGMLALTDATAKFSDTKLPFPAFVIEVPPGYLPLPSLATAGTSYTGPVRLLVHQHERRMTYHEGYDTYAETDDPNATAEDWLRIDVFTDDFRAFMSINKKVSELSDGTIASKLMKWRGNTDGSAAHLEVDAEPGTRELHAAVLSMACCFALWVNATDALENAPKPRPRRKPKKKKKKERTPNAWPNIWVIGREVKLDRELRDTAKEQAQDLMKNRKGWKLRTQKIVRGHFKRQRHGKGNALVKIIFVEPYPRGPDDAEAWSSNFKVEGDGED